MNRYPRVLGVAVAATALFASCTAWEPAPPPVPERVWPGGVVAADHPLASEAGAEILQAGGNAVDAAVATSFALSVVRPFSCGIGGGGFMLVRLVDDPSTPEPDDPLQVAIDYRERAPMAITPDHFETLPDDASRFSGNAVAVPGTVAGLLHALERYGTMDRATVLAPAVRLAREGYAADASHLHAALTLSEFLESGDTTPRGYAFMRNRFTNRGEPGLGDEIRLPEQARVLELIAERGAAGFYEGDVAEAIVSAVQQAGGVMTLEDLRRYRPTESEPLTADRFGRRWICMPLPSSGGVTTLQALALLEERRDLWTRRGPRHPLYLHVLIESMKHAFADRATALGDPEFVDVPIGRMLDSGLLAERAREIDPKRTFPPASYGVAATPAIDSGTSHLSVVDRFGNAVACTETINLLFGSRVAVSAYGFVLNNEMDDFLTRRGVPNAFGLVQADSNLPEPWKRPLSSMSPTIVVGADGRVEAVAGASGGPRIITGTMQALLNALVWGMGAGEAVDAPRVHHQWLPDSVYTETIVWPGQRGWPITTDEVREGLTSRGHELTTRDHIGVVQLIRRAPEGVGWQAASDPRKGGAPAGE